MYAVGCFRIIVVSLQINQMDIRGKKQPLDTSDRLQAVCGRDYKIRVPVPTIDSGHHSLTQPNLESEHTDWIEMYD